jgi:hypothetical protein
MSRMKRPSQNSSQQTLDETPERRSGSLFDSDAQTITIAVNCVGVIGQRSQPGRSAVLMRPLVHQSLAVAEQLRLPRLDPVPPVCEREPTQVGATKPVGGPGVGGRYRVPGSDVV